MQLAGARLSGPCQSLTALQFGCLLLCRLSAGYLTLNEVFSYGALMSVVNLTLWGLLGGAWWAFLGFF